MNAQELPSASCGRVPGAWGAVETHSFFDWLVSTSATVGQTGENLWLSGGSGGLEGRQGGLAMDAGRSGAMGLCGGHVDQGEFFDVVGRGGVAVRRYAVADGSAPWVEWLGLEEGCDRGLDHGGVLDYGEEIELAGLATVAFFGPSGFRVGESCMKCARSGVSNSFGV